MAVTAAPAGLGTCWLLLAAVPPWLIACEDSYVQGASPGPASPSSGEPGAGGEPGDGPSLREPAEGSSVAASGTSASNETSALREGRAVLHVPRSAGAGAEVPDDGGQTWVFEPSAVHTYELTLDPRVWASLQRNARDEQYVPAELVAAGRRLTRVGLRFKGSLGTLVSCFADDGSLRCEKLSMKLEFDEYVDGQRFFGLRRLTFNSMLSDDTLLHERLAYRVYREMGLVASRSAHARLVINGEDWGVFSLVEEVDGRFTDHHFENGDGNLYKEVWPGNTAESALGDALKTNEERADHAGFLQFQAELLAALPSALPAVVERYVDIDAALAYLAVDQALVNWDGVTAFYCYDGSSCQNHNYYWYQAELEPRFTLIPWDLDNTFQPSLLANVPGVLEQPEDCSLRYDATGRELKAPGCDRLLRGLISGRVGRYGAQLDRLLAGPLAPGVVEGWIDELALQLGPEVMTDARGPSPSTFQTAVARLRDSISGLRQRVQGEREALRQ